MKLARSGLFYKFASESGSTPLQYAVCRGDLEIVELLLEHGANSSTKNDLGRHLLSYVISNLFFFLNRTCSLVQSHLILQN